MSERFFDYVRGRSDAVPEGYTAAGMRVYRHLVWLGASQMIESSFPQLRDQLGEEAWRVLIEEFIRQSEWTSNYYGDLTHEFSKFLEHASA